LDVTYVYKYTLGKGVLGRKATPKRKKKPKRKKRGVRINMKWTSSGDRCSQKRANRSLPRTKCDLVVAISTRRALNGGPVWKPCLFPRAGRLCRPAQPLLFPSRGGPRARARACFGPGG